MNYRLVLIALNVALSLVFLHDAPTLSGGSPAVIAADCAVPVTYVSTRRWRRRGVVQQVAPAPAAPAGEPTPAAPPGTAAKAKDEWKSLFDGKTLGNWKSTDFGGQGEVKVENGQIVLELGEPLTGVTWQKKGELPTDNFEITLEAIKLKGDDFFCGLTFPVRKSHCSFIVGGWGGGIVGISSINNFDASENETTKYQTFKKDQWYKIRVRVADDKIQAWIDNDQLVDVEIKDKKISTRFEVDLSQPLGISAYRTKAALRNIKIRTLEEEKK